MPESKEAIAKALAIAPEIKLNSFSMNKRHDSIHEAISWPSSQDQDHKAYTTVFRYGAFEVKMGKPGKEAAPDYDRCRRKDGTRTNNRNDMLPSVFKDGRYLDDKALTFVGVFEALQSIARMDEHALELIGSLLFRDAYMMDHREHAKGIWRYEPPEAVLDAIEGRIGEASGMPFRVFLHLVDSLALNEDVKYFTLGYDTIKDAYGRRNNLLTCARIIAVFLGRDSLAKFAGSFARPPAGVAPISRKSAETAFPILFGGRNPTLNEF